MKDKSMFLFIYKFDSLLYRVIRLVLSCCFASHDAVVKEHNSQVGRFIRYLPEKVAS